MPHQRGATTTRREVRIDSKRNAKQTKNTNRPDADPEAQAPTQPTDEKDDCGPEYQR